MTTEPTIFRVCFHLNRRIHSSLNNHFFFFFGGSPICGSPLVGLLTVYVSGEATGMDSVPDADWDGGGGTDDVL